MPKKIFPVMFHHFHDGKRHIKTQGSFNKDKFYKLIKKIGLRNILSPHDFFNRVKEKKLKSNQTCITFDDGIKSQFDIAFPILVEFKLTGFFFIYTSIFDKKINFLELNRYFREKYFKNVNDYYEEFYLIIKKNLDWNKIKNTVEKNKKYISRQKRIYNFYSTSDIRFRFIRNYLLSEQQFNKINIKLFKNHNFDYKKANSKLYINSNHLKILVKYKNIIGLHSHSHPTNLKAFSYKKQFSDFKFNKLKIEKITKQRVFSLAYPLGQYNSHTIKVARRLGIKLAFLSNTISPKNNLLLTPREDHNLLFKKLF